MVSEIGFWLENEGSFAAGVELYRRAGGGDLLPELEQQLQRDWVTPGAYDRLRVALHLVHDRLGGEAPALTRKSSAPTANDEPETVLALRRQGRLLKKRESDVHGQLRALANLPNPAEHEARLYELATEMMEDIQPALDEAYGQLREWEQTGRLPVPGRQEVIRETVDKMKRYENMRVRCVRLRKWLAGDLADELRTRYADELKEKEVEMEAIKNELGL